MIQSLNTFPTYFHPTGRQNIGFSGKNFVEQKILGEKILIPRAVHDAKQSVRLLVGVIESKTGEHPQTSQANGVYLGDNLFLSVEHLFYDDKTYEPLPFDHLFSGKCFKNSSQKFHKANNKYSYNFKGAHFLDWDSVFDLALLESEDPNTKPIKIARIPPKTGETLYLIGTKEPLRGNKAIPFTLICEEDNNSSYILTSDFINRNYDKFDESSNSESIDINEARLKGLSGSPLVNNNGELVGIICTEIKVPKSNKIEIEATKLIDIKDFLKRSRYSRELYKSLKSD